MKILVYGLGYVGLTTAACLTREGHQVVGIDVSEPKIREVNAGTSPIEEPGLEELLRKAVATGLLGAVSDGSEHLASCELAIVCVGTPSASDGSHNMSYVAEVSRQIAVAIDPHRPQPLTIVYRSTIRPGTVEQIIRPIFRAKLGAQMGAIELVYNPEFLREAVAIQDYFAPPKIVIGTHDGQPSPKMNELNKNIDAPVFYTSYGEAEFTKFVDNTFHALKVSFANEIGRVCVHLGIEATVVHQIFVADTKLNISARYFRPGGAFGGSCLPKDVRALQHIAKELGARTQVIDALLPSNEAHKDFLFDLAVSGLAPGSAVLLLGLAFKSSSDDLRESPKVDLARRLLQAGFKLSVYDPWLKPERLIGQNLGYSVTRLPNLQGLLIDKARAESERFDVVLDTNGLSDHLRLVSPNIVNLHQLA